MNVDPGVDPLIGSVIGQPVDRSVDRSVDQSVAVARPIAVDQRYRALVQAAVWRRWGDELAIYEGRSARTHLLADGHAELFGLMAAHAEPLSLPDIAAEFETGEGAQSPLNDAETAALHALVHELVALGLVEAVPAA